MPDADVPLYVRLPAEQAQRLTDISSHTGQSKRQLVESAIRSHLDEDGTMVVGRASLREDLPEVLSLEQAAVLLRVEDDALRSLAEAGGVPARRIGEQWRFTRSALLSWLGG